MDIVTVTGRPPLFNPRITGKFVQPIKYLGVVAGGGVPADVYLRGSLVHVVFAADVDAHFVISMPHHVGTCDPDKFITHGPYKVAQNNALEVVDEVTFNEIMQAAYELVKPFVIAEIQLRAIAEQIKDLDNEHPAFIIGNIKTVLGV